MVKKCLTLAILLLVLLMTACGQPRQTEALQDELFALQAALYQVEIDLAGYVNAYDRQRRAVAALRSEIGALRSRQQHQTRRYPQLHQQIADEQQQANDLQDMMTWLLAYDQPLSHGLTRPQVADAFLQDYALRASLDVFLGLRATLLFGHGRSITVSEGYVLVQGEVPTGDDVPWTWAQSWWYEPQILLAYHVDPVTHAITWQPMAYCIGHAWAGLRPVPPPRPAHRHFTDMPTVTVRNYYVDFFAAYFDRWRYHEAHLPGATFFEDYLAFMIDWGIRDMWLVGEKLYVDLYPRMFGMGNVGSSAMLANMLIVPSLLSIPFVYDLSISIAGQDDFYIYVLHISEVIDNFRIWP